MMRILTIALALAASGALHAQRPALDSANAQAATAEYQRTGSARVVHAGTYSMVPYGHVQPTLRCAALRVCTIELEAGERVIDSVVGDPERWVVDFAAGPDSTPLVVTKPVALPDACDQTTNLVVTTSRRIYHVTLDSPPCSGQGGSTNPDQPYHRHVKFYYPDDRLVRHHSGPAASAAQADAGGVELEEAEPGMPAGDLADLHFDYQVIPDRRFPWVPRVVYDNGQQICIRLPAEAYHSDLAVLYEVDARGGYELVHYAVRDGCILTDRVMRRMVLLIAGGQDGDPLRLLIVRRESRRGAR
ncbi:TrbG/VirB9 family P-type conjugative transfer protein [Longimicrobium terrae]|uniref:Type IV secretion system protein VirB9 n=1 Tax=Longimicrobium terrae TaxID=1639882 RepID=A0A841GX84_9BACT|nr:TrbG/VirB9 family P-type conjugative transfer protein [Longimicrobium terrae]MBB4636029.1 type IV secretion system protein VirB9 [Longimicrobium terrae]MBB6070425.1 type IV secretion system protein VirB9 [Longimicrobium terrae]NNC30919.1 TrbG/VirB9 family P-type conjugative transfer protein [Longimicrobium terrae]